MKWAITCKEFKEVRDAIANGDSKSIFTQLIAICEKYAKKEWNFAEDFEELANELKEIEVDDLEDDDTDYWLNEFYDLCDNSRVWLEL